MSKNEKQKQKLPRKLPAKFLNDKHNASKVLSAYRINKKNFNSILYFPKSGVSVLKNSILARQIAEDLFKVYHFENDNRILYMVTRHKARQYIGKVGIHKIFNLDEYISEFNSGKIEPRRLIILV